MTSPTLMNLMKSVPQEHLRPLVAGLIALLIVLMTAVLYSSFSQWQQSRQAVLSLQEQAGNAALVAQGVSQLRTDLEQRAALLSHSADAGNDIAMHFMRKMSELATRHRLVLGNVSPAPPQAFLMTQEYPISFEIRGPYEGIAYWIQDMERTSAFVSFSRLSFREAGEQSGIILNASLSVYQYKGQQ